jgi:hypothetical protein
MTFQRKLTFGVDRDPAVVEEAVERGAARSSNGKGRLGALKVNPMLAVVGPGPDGAICRDCIHLFRVGGVAGRYYKCDLRRVSSGPATDHRVRWPACAKFEARP